MSRFQFDLFSPPIIESPASVPADAVFQYGGRSLRVHRVYGNDARAPVIVEELASFGETTLKGQFALWSLDAVRRAMKH
jgi:hypothetical protein